SSLRYKVLEIFKLDKEGSFTSDDISKKIDIDKALLNTYLNQYRNSGILKIVDKKGRYKVYQLSDKNPHNENGVLHKLQEKNKELMEKNKELMEKNFSNSESNKLKEYIRFLMNFFQENKSNIGSNARKYINKFKEIAGVFK
ncbi:MAG: hypothetical protein ACFFG0_07470, partial [Candidatus Thorarchaeota archaeon]